MRKINLKVERESIKEKEDVMEYQIYINSIPHKVVTAIAQQHHISLEALSALIIHISKNDIIDGIMFTAHDKGTTCLRCLALEGQDTDLSGMTIQYFSIDHAPI